MDKKKQLTKAEVLTSVLNAISNCHPVGIYRPFPGARELYSGQNLANLAFLAQGGVQFLGEVESLTDWDAEGFPADRKIYRFEVTTLGCTTVLELAIETKWTESI